ncbi:MAG: zinc-binding dehydrogenase [Parvibaculum sp.]|nr:zinc-binding dehydrogenase [Parvibaculum sp.]
MLPTKTKAAILVEQRQPLVVAEIDLPPALDVGQVLVQIQHSGICGSQIGEIDGAKGPDRFLPHLLGHEASGTVLAVGAGVRQVKPDDKVVMHWRKGPGIEAQPPAYLWDGKKVNAGWVTTFSQHAIISENRLTKIPADSNMEVAALFGCAVTTGFGVVVNNAKINIGESVVVFGAGGIGLNIIQAAALSTAYPIIAVDLYDNKLELARSLGATHLINAKTSDARATIEKITGVQGLDVFIDNTGQPPIIQMGYEITKPQGRVVLVGVPKKGSDTTIYSLPLHFGKSISGSHGGEAVPEIDIPRYQSLYAQGVIDLDRLVTARFSLDDINKAIAAMRGGDTAGRVMVRM